MLFFFLLVLCAFEAKRPAKKKGEQRKSTGPPEGRDYERVGCLLDLKYRLPTCTTLYRPSALYYFIQDIFRAHI
jgi:hypothetical protein